jgi:hypothetical protein
MELLTSKENLEENINILCIKKNPWKLRSVYEILIQ